MRLPLRTPWLLLGAILIPGLMIVQAFHYYPRLIDSGRLPTDADSIGIPIGSTILGAPILTMLLALWAAPALYGARERPRLLAWRRERPLRSTLGTLFYGGAAMWMVFDIGKLIAQAQAGFDLLLLIGAVPLLLWNVALQAACVDRPDQDEADALSA